MNYDYNNIKRYPDQTQGSTKTVWLYDELLNEPTGSSSDKDNIFNTPQKSSSQLNNKEIF